MTVAPGSIFPRNGVPANQAAPGADDNARATCPDRWYKSSCNPRFDPQSMNSIMAELVNAVNMSCIPDQPNAGPAWNCSRQDNLLMAMCRHFNEKLFGCLDQNFPDLGTTCGSVRYLAVSDDGECRRIGFIDQQTIPRASGSYGNVGNHPVNQTGFVLPRDFPNPTNFYNLADFIADGGTDPNNRSGINEARVRNSRLARGEFDNPCPQQFNLTLLASFARETTAQEAYDKIANSSYRWRTNAGPWNYPYTPANGRVISVGGQSAITGRYSTVIPLVINVPAGHVEIEWFYIAEPGNFASFNANTNVLGAGTGNPSPQFTLERRIG